MKGVFAALLLFLLIAGEAEASVFFKIVEVPTIYVSPEGEAGFTIFVHNLGSQSTYAGLIFREIPEGLSIAGPRCTKWVDSGTRREFDCQLRVEAGDVPPGNYSFEVGIVATGAPPEWTRVPVIVAEGADSKMEGEADLLPEPEEYPACPIVREEGEAPPEKPQGAKGTPGLGFPAALGAMAVALHLRGRGRRG